MRDRSLYSEFVTVVKIIIIIIIIDLQIHKSSFLSLSIFLIIIYFTHTFLVKSQVCETCYSLISKLLILFLYPVLCFVYLTSILATSSYRVSNSRFPTPLSLGQWVTVSICTTTTIIIICTVFTISSCYYTTGTF